MFLEIEYIVHKTMHNSTNAQTQTTKSMSQWSGEFPGNGWDVLAHNSDVFGRRGVLFGEGVQAVCGRCWGIHASDKQITTTSQPTDI